MNAGTSESKSAADMSPEDARNHHCPLVNESPDETGRIMPVFVLVMWLGCLLVGTLGFALPYPRPDSKTPPRKPKAEAINVELVTAPSLLDATALSPTLASGSSSATSVEPGIPRPIPVAHPSPALAFAVPLEAPVKVATARNARPDVRTDGASSAAAPPAQPLVFGRGEGQQPAPDYPLRARREGQEGTVVVRMTVGEDGHVKTAEAVSPSPWPLLNEAAVSTVRERWHFPAGGLRNYEVSIHFELTR